MKAHESTISTALAIGLLVMAVLVLPRLFSL
jgi:hypothetical protein